MVFAVSETPVAEDEVSIVPIRQEQRKACDFLSTAGRTTAWGLRSCLRRSVWCPWWSSCRQVPRLLNSIGQKDRESLLAFYDFPAEHWIHIRTSNVIESSFATIRHRSKQAKGCFTRNTMLAMIYKMGQCAEGSWRKLRGFKHLAKVFEGVRFKDGIEVTEADKTAA